MVVILMKPLKMILTLLFQGLKKNSIILCDDYSENFCIPEVKKAIDDFANQNSLKIDTLANRFAQISI